MTFVDFRTHTLYPCLACLAKPVRGHEKGKNLENQKTFSVAMKAMRAGNYPLARKKFETLLQSKADWGLVHLQWGRCLSIPIPTALERSSISKKPRALFPQSTRTSSAGNRLPIQWQLPMAQNLLERPSNFKTIRGSSSLSGTM